MTDILREQAEKITEAAIAEARRLNLEPLTVAVLDSGGHMKTLTREDGASLIRPQIATAKAWGAISVGVSSRTLGEMADQRPMFMNALIDLSGQRLMPVPGGVLIRDKKDQLIGAVGISGDLSDKDEHSAIVGIEAAGLIPDAGQ